MTEIYLGKTGSLIYQAGEWLPMQVGDTVYLGAAVYKVKRRWWSISGTTRILRVEVKETK